MLDEFGWGKGIGEDGRRAGEDGTRNGEDGPMGGLTREGGGAKIQHIGQILTPVPRELGSLRFAPAILLPQIRVAP